jgi:hypothetical protein
MYKAYLCTMIRRQRTKDKQYVQGIPMYNGQKKKVQTMFYKTLHHKKLQIGLHEHLENNFKYIITGNLSFLLQQHVYFHEKGYI